MTEPQVVRVYRALLRFYPRPFRDEYGTDMTLLLAHQLRDEPAARVVTRAALDLAITVPTRHLEARMNRQPTTSIPVFFSAVSVAGALLAIVAGSSIGMAAVGLAVAVVAGALAVVSFRHTRAVTAARPATAHWWKFIAGGGVTLAAVIIGTTITGEVSSGLWLPMMIVLFSALVSLAGGLVLGLAHLAGGRAHRPAG